MKSKIAFLVSLIFIITAFFSGCTLFEIDRDLYLKEVVATVDSDIEINKEDLIRGFNNYGQTLINNYGFTLQDAMEKVVELLINRELLLREAKSLFSLTAIETSKLWKDTYDIINENLKYYEQEILKERGNINSETEDEIKSGIYEAYIPKAEVVYDEVQEQYIIKLIEENDELSGVEIIAGGVENFVEFVSNDTLTREAKVRYIKALKSSEKGKKFQGANAYSDASVFNREIQRIYDNQEENYYLNKLRKTIYSTNITPQNVLDEYKNLVVGSYHKYQLNPSAYSEDIQSSASSVFYYPCKSESIDQFFYVSHILIKYSDEQQSQIEELKNDLNNQYITQNEYNNRLNLITSQISTSKKIDGVETTETFTANEILAFLNNELAGKSVEEKSEIFNNYIYMYNQDDGILNAEFAYVIGEKDSKMVASFNDASRQLHQDGIVGKVSQLVKSEYGVHIIFYCGEIKNIFEISTLDEFNLSNEDLYTLSQTKLYLLNNKTYFDLVFDKLYNDKYSAYENLLVSSLKQNADIKIYKNAYKDLIKN